MQIAKWTRPTALMLSVLGLTAVLTTYAAAQDELTLPEYGSSMSSSPAVEATPTITPSVSSGPIYTGESYYQGQGGGSYAAGGVAYSDLLGAHLRARYNTRSYGQTRGNLDLGTMKLYDQGDSAWFIDGQVALNDVNPFGYNVGVGYRFLTLPLLPNSPDSEKIAGVSLWTDGMMTSNDNFISQLGISLEYLGDYWDVRGNVYIPFADVEVGEFDQVGSVSYLDTFLVQETIAGADEALTVTEMELARRIGELDAWGFIGGYGLNGEQTDTAGYKLGVRGYATPDINLQLAVTDDDEFGTNLVFSGTWFIGRTRTNTPCRGTIADRMREPVIRNDYVAIRQRTVTSGNILTGDIDGDGDDEAIRVVHVDSTAADGGDGSFASPLNELSDIDANSTTDSIILVHGGSTFTDDAAVLKDGQRLLGEGGDIDHVVDTTRFGTISLPETAAGAQSGAIPTATILAGADGITLANDTQEVSNLSLSGGARGIVSPNGSAAVSLNNLTIANTTGNGIELTAGALETTEGDASTLTSTFTPTISDVTFSGVGGDDIDIDATESALAVTSTLVENITITDVASTGGGGIGIDLRNNTNAATITDYTRDGGGASTGGIQITGTGSNDGQVTITNATISNEGGFGVRIASSDAAHTLSEMEISDTLGAAFNIDGGPTDAGTITTFSGTISQSLNASAVLIEGEHAGTVIFSEAVTDAGLVNATNGDGLQFDNADGTYLFSNAVVLNGGDAGIDIRNDSDADITITDGTITNPTGEAVLVDGGNAGLDFTGQITQGNSADTIAVQGGHTGTLAFSESTADAGVINATNGAGLRFDDADGGYTFSHAVVLDGTSNLADTGIDIVNDSDGTFTFADATITSPTGTALNINGGESVVNYTGTITQANAALAVSITDHGDDVTNTGSVIINANADDDAIVTATNGEGLAFSNADGSYSFNGTVTLNGTGNVADTGIDITGDSDGTFTFTDATITSPTGIGLNVDGGSADVNYTGFITQANNAAALSVSGGHDGTIMIDEETAGDGIISATNGTGLQFDNADGNYFLNDAVTLNGGDAGIDITNDSSGLFSFSADTEITNPTGVGLNVAASDATVTYAGTIDNNADFAVSLVGNSGGSVTVSGQVTDTGTGVQILNNTGGSYTINGGLDISSGSDDAVTIASNSDSTINIDDADIETTSGDGFLVTSNTDSTITISNATVDTTTGNAIDANNNSGSAISFNTMTLTTTTGDVMALNNNTTGSVDLIGVSLNSTSGTGLQVAGTDDLSGAANTVDSGSGTGVSITGSSIAVGGLAFDSVDVDGAANGISLNTVTGSQISFGLGGSSIGDGGVIQNTTGDAVSIVDTENVALSFMQIGTDNAGGGSGIEVTHTGASASNVALTSNAISNTDADGVLIAQSGTGEFTLVMTSNSIDNNGGQSIEMNLNGSTNDKNITLSGNTLNNGTGAEALLIDATSGTNNLLITNNSSFSLNNAGVTAVSINSSGTATLNTTIQDSTFTNSAGGGEAIAITNNGGQVRLALTGNTATPGTAGNDDFLLTNSAGTFLIEDLNTVGSTPDDLNTVTGGGSVSFAPNAAAFTPSASGTTPTP